MTLSVFEEPFVGTAGLGVSGIEADAGLEDPETETRAEADAETETAETVEKEDDSPLEFEAAWAGAAR